MQACAADDEATARAIEDDIVAAIAEVRQRVTTIRHGLLHALRARFARGAWNNT
jgi:hypothetical protein